MVTWVRPSLKNNKRALKRSNPIIRSLLVYLIAPALLIGGCQAEKTQRSGVVTQQEIIAGVTREAIRKELPPPLPNAPTAPELKNAGALQVNRSNLDTDNPGFVRLQSPAVAMAGLPLDRYNRVDWARALNEGYIEPRASRTDIGAQMELRKSEILMNQTKNMPHVLFPHKTHTQWLACSNCHPIPFKPIEHANIFTMNDILRGEACGQCHGRVAFPLMICERCHSVPMAPAQ